MTNKQFQICLIFAFICLALNFLGYLWCDWAAQEVRICIKLQPVGAYSSGANDPIK